MEREGHHHHHLQDNNQDIVLLRDLVLVEAMVRTLQQSTALQPFCGSWWEKVHCELKGNGHLPTAASCSVRFEQLKKERPEGKDVQSLYTILRTERIAKLSHARGQLRAIIDALKSADDPSVIMNTMACARFVRESQLVKLDGTLHTSFVQHDTNHRLSASPIPSRVKNEQQHQHILNHRPAALVVSTHSSSSLIDKVSDLRKEVQQQEAAGVHQEENQEENLFLARSLSYPDSAASSSSKKTFDRDSSSGLAKKLSDKTERPTPLRIQSIDNTPPLSPTKQRNRVRRRAPPPSPVTQQQQQQSLAVLSNQPAAVISSDPSTNTLGASQSALVSPVPTEPAPDDKLRKLRQQHLLQLWKTINDNPCAAPFRKPVADNEEWSADYHRTVKKKMDLSTIKARIESGTVNTLTEMWRLLLLMLQNAEMYNPADSEIFKVAVELRDTIRKMLPQAREQESLLARTAAATEEKIEPHSTAGATKDTK